MGLGVNLWMKITQEIIAFNLVAESIQRIHAAMPAHAQRVNLQLNMHACWLTKTLLVTTTVAMCVTIAVH